MATEYTVQSFHQRKSLMNNKTYLFHDIINVRQTCTILVNIGIPVSNGYWVCCLHMQANHALAQTMQTTHKDGAHVLLRTCYRIPVVYWKHFSFTKYDSRKMLKGSSGTCKLICIKKQKVSHGWGTSNCKTISNKVNDESFGRNLSETWLHLIPLFGQQRLEKVLSSLYCMGLVLCTQLT